MTLCGPQLSLECSNTEAPRRLSESPDGAAGLGKRLQSTGATRAATPRAPGHRRQRGGAAQVGRACAAGVAVGSGPAP